MLISRVTPILVTGLLSLIVGGCGLMKKLEGGPPPPPPPPVWQISDSAWLNSNCDYLGQVRSVDVEGNPRNKLWSLTRDMGGNAFRITYLANMLADALVYRCPPELIDPDASP